MHLIGIEPDMLGIESSFLNGLLARRRKLCCNSTVLKAPVSAMAHQLSFHVGLGLSLSPYPFHPFFLTVSVQTNGSPVPQLESDQIGFLIWKWLRKRDNGAAVYQHLPAEPELI
jgi:hypothetical protein